MLLEDILSVQNKLQITLKMYLFVLRNYSQFFFSFSVCSL
jgi:hypothetical protein